MSQDKRKVERPGGEYMIQDCDHATDGGQMGGESRDGGGRQAEQSQGDTHQPGSRQQGATRQPAAEQRPRRSKLL